MYGLLARNLGSRTTAADATQHVYIRCSHVTVIGGLLYVVGQHSVLCEVK